MKSIIKIISAFILGAFLWSCGSTPISTKKDDKEAPVVIANDSLEYEIIIIDPGFTYYLNAIAQPQGFYSQGYLEARNRVWVTIWNQRFMDSGRYNPNIYENQIQYNRSVDYGYEVNYKLFNYFLFAQRKYKMSLGGGFRGDRIN